MNWKHLWLAVSLVAVGGTIAIQPAQADHRYREYRYYRGRDRDEIRRREFLRMRMFDLADRIRLADRERDIGPREANRLYRELDDVRDFLRNDHFLDGREFERRQDDLNDVGSDLRRILRRNRGRYGRYDRYDRDHRYWHYDRYDDWYRRRYRD